LVSVGRLVAVGALIIALIAVEPLLGGLDQAFQYIQEYSGFIYPGIIVVFGLGLLWKRASSTAAVWTAILTIPMGILFKIMLPNVAFQFRAGYIFILLFVFFVVVSYFDKKYVRCEQPSETDQKQMLLWAKILGSAGILMILAAAIVTILGMIHPGGNPDTSVIAYLNDIGFQAFYFFGVLTGSSAIWLYSNSKDRVQDVKALPINLKLFATDRGYTIGTCGIVLITFLLYALLW
jgi:sodium/glucose cotransporter